MICSGIYTALITPFNPSGALDLAGLRRLVNMQREAHIDGVVALGTTGEAPTLSLEEKEFVIKTVREEWRDLPLMVGCGAYSTTQTIENIQHAASHGADSALVITPFYNKPTQEGVFRHFESLSRVSPLPIVVYNHPGRTGVHIETLTLQRISDLPGVIGVKETSGSIAHVCDILYTIKQNRPDFAVMSGDDNMALALMALGGDGVISGASNLVPEAMMELADACRDGDFITAQKLNLALTPLFKALLLETNPIPLKAILHLAGLPAGEPRLPLTPLLGKCIPVLEETLTQLKIETQRHKDAKKEPILC